MLDKTSLTSTATKTLGNRAKWLKTYIEEAEFFEKVLDSDVSQLPTGSHLVEIGSGIGLLSLNLASRGFIVTAFEPQASGFNEMHQMRDLVTNNWKGLLPKINFSDISVNKLTKLDLPADYVFAINVIEHVQDYRTLIHDGLNQATSQGVFRIICPNYSIPYEPHFEIPVIISKKLTFRIFRRKIEQSEIPKSKEFWQDLSWPTQRELKRYLKSEGLEFEFSREATNFYVNRALSDSNFINRKGLIFGSLIKSFALLAKYLTQFIPLSLIPIIDCRIKKSTK